MRPLKKELLLLTRTVHIYLTMLAMLVLFFFSITGFMLNHEDWFSLNTARTSDRTATLPAEIANSKDRLVLVEYLRKAENARGEMKSFSTDDDATRVGFAAPGRLIEFTIDPSTGDTQVHEEVRNLLALFADLHRGKYAGGAWHRVIDATAIALFLATLTGLILFFSLPKRRTVGIIALALGIAICVGVYVWWVP